MYRRRADSTTSRPAMRCSPVRWWLFGLQLDLARPRRGGWPLRNIADGVHARLTGRHSGGRLGAPAGSRRGAVVSGIETSAEQPRLHGISEIRAFLRTNDTPMFFVSPTAFNLLGIDRWVRNFFYVTHYNSFEGGHARVFTPANRTRTDFTSIEDIDNHLLRSAGARVDRVARPGRQGRAPDSRRGERGVRGRERAARGPRGPDAVWRLGQDDVFGIAESGDWDRCAKVSRRDDRGGVMAGIKPTCGARSPSTRWTRSRRDEIRRGGRDPAPRPGRGPSAGASRSIELREPPKERSAGSAGRPIEREAEVICWNRDDGRTYKARVSLGDDRVVSWEHQPDGQPQHDRRRVLRVRRGARARTRA